MAREKKEAFKPEKWRKFKTAAQQKDQVQQNKRGITQSYLQGKGRKQCGSQDLGYAVITGRALGYRTGFKGASRQAEL